MRLFVGDSCLSGMLLKVEEGNLLQASRECFKEYPYLTLQKYIFKSEP
jgi:hypothetical protein